MEKRNARILVVDDDLDILQAAKLFLKQHFTTVHIENNPKNIPVILQENHYDVVLLDMNFSREAISGKEGFMWLKTILEINPITVVIFITGYGDIELAVQGIKEGASHFLLKPWDNKKLLATMEASLQMSYSKKELEDLRNKKSLLLTNQNDVFADIIGMSKSMEKVLATVEKVAPTVANILILGENGTGKEVIARAIHKASERNKEVFISVDLGAISESLFESELFGFKKGAFTDAKEDRAGRFEVANKGSIFLDEIGNLSQPLQSKLLSVIQNKKVIRIGTNREIPIDVRVICATNMPLYQMVSENKFRQDLLYRINTVEIQVPPLRERQEDIPLLADHFLNIYCKKYKSVLKRIHPSAMARLKTHKWPGNIRELQHSIERAVILSDSDVLQSTDFFSENPERHDPQLPDFPNLNLEETERLLVRKVIEKHGNNISKAARELGLTRASLYRRIEKYGL
ncbi:MAG: sigma-54 dependent transcriptional regulator [Bacteroidales bacterium]|nr:sigma-54 dependent transcriptional regulator [Bacteroidales bacterium]